ncbi:sterol 3-beta-glucosyltransferase [Cladorrhinum sp. PSN259]|nr:sterol 3-beta-glucosyltransferase [Cladorrhinum sp. PSN259]
MDSEPQRRSPKGDDGPLDIETIYENGEKKTVVLNPEGKVVYPAYVPPPTQSPPQAGTSTKPPSQEQQQHHIKDDNPFQSNARKMPRVNSEDRTPSPKTVMLQRARTEVSPTLHDESSSESSSDEEHLNKLSNKERKKALKQKQKQDRYRRFSLGNEHYTTKGKVSKQDGRLSISLKDTSNTGYLAKALGQAARKMAPQKKADKDDAVNRDKADSEAAQKPSHPQPSTPSTFQLDMPQPRLNIVIMVIGSRGDAQPFLKIGKVLKEQYGHRVRIATHPAFRDFVEKDSGLEFFSVGGDPSELMSFMVKNPGMIPTLSSIKAGDISKRRQAMATMFRGFWRACINATDDETNTHNLKMMGARDPFVADAIIANPPSFAHIHCAEALGIPLHLMFTFPYTPTQAFPHPLARIKGGGMSGPEQGDQQGYANWISYPLVEMMVWQGLGDLVNDFRVKTLGLDPVSTLWAPGATYRLRVPMSYLWSPGVVPKPEDWGEEVGVEGWVFLELGGTFKPEEGLKNFLEKGKDSDKDLVYIGFGSIVVDDADKFTEMIFEAVKKAGVRALVSKGWGGLGAGEGLEVPEDIYMLDNTPHDWLFPRVKATVIHGGAGTTAIALKCGKPTMIVPFFGDQYFWGSMVSNAGAGPEPVPYKELDADKLAEGIKFCLTEEAQTAVDKIAKSIAEEGDGAENACRAFHKGLVLHGERSMRCAILPEMAATWKMKDTGLRLSPVAAEMLVQRRLVSWKKLRLLRHNEWNDFEGPGEPITGITGSIMGTVGNVFGGIGGVPYRVAKKFRHSKEKEKEKEKKKRKGSANGHTSVKKKDGNKQSNGSGGGGGSDDEPPQVETATAGAIHRRDSSSSTSTLSNPAEEVAHQVGHGALKSAAAIAKAPVDLSVALAQGFHNAPRLYGDDTVRRPIRVTGMKSGLKAAGHEFVFGIYDGWTGVVRLPYRGAKQSGVRGFVTGVGMGLTGFILKDIAAIIGPVGYTLKGVVKQADRGKQPIKYIRKARVAQGERELRQLSDEEKEEKGKEVVKAWAIMWKLWEELERMEKTKGKNSLRAKLGGRHRKARKRREWDVLFESSEVAERSLEGLKKGEGVDVILRREKGRFDREGKWKEDKEEEAVVDGGDKRTPVLEQEGIAVQDGVAVKSSDEDEAVSRDLEGYLSDGKKENETNPFAAAAVEPSAPSREAEVANSVAGAKLLAVEAADVKA